jgi:thiamine-phosphate pyrophosphorylase
MIVITNPTSIPNEIEIIHSLFQEGLELLHIRKPEYSGEEIKIFISEINLENRSQLVLHSHHRLATEFGINRIHFTTKARIQTLEMPKKFIKSTSTHSIVEFNKLSTIFDYAFLSPVFPSISKVNYQSNSNLFEEVKKRTNHSTKLIALGGITADKIQFSLENGFDDVALLGSIWQSNNPIENFKLCQQSALLY